MNDPGEQALEGMVNSAANHRLLLALINGALESPLWSGFLGELRKQTGADYASLVFRPPGLPPNEVFHLYSGSKFPPAIEQLYRDSFYQHDPMPYHDMVEGRVYSLSELIRQDDPAHAAYLKTVMLPSGMNRARMLRIDASSDASGWLTLTRRERDFEERDNDLLQSLVPYLRSVLHNHLVHEKERTRALLDGDAIQRLRYGWITLDASGRVLEANHHGHHILENSGILYRDEHQCLQGPSLRQGRELIAAIRKLASTPNAKPRALVISREPWLDILLVPAGRQSISATSVPAVVAYLHGDSTLSSDRCEQLTQLFGLLPSEARLALALGRGMSITEAAAELNLTLETARTYSKKVYAKMGARGHADVVLFIHRSILQIA